jgi:predicted PurR-regulated permease PerM
LGIPKGTKLTRSAEEDDAGPLPSTHPCLSKLNRRGSYRSAGFLTTVTSSIAVPGSLAIMAEMDLLDSMLDLTRRLPPTNIEENVASLVELCPDVSDELLGSVDQPLQVRTDAATGKEYLICDYNRDGESYR